MQPTPTRTASRGNPQKWLRRLHAWCGLALVAMLLLFTITGFLLNHRSVMKIPALDRQEATQILPLSVAPATPQALAAMLAPQLGVPATAFAARVEPARELPWGDGTMSQPARWILRTDTPSQAIQIDHWVGSRQAEARHTKPNLWLHLARLHMAIGTGPGWILLSDLAAAGLTFLGLSGFLLWGRLHGSPRRLAALVAGGLSLAGGLAWFAG